MSFFFTTEFRSHASSKRRGYILLLTILVTSILLAVGLGISTISIKEVALSAFLRDSERALAAATNGAECALFWDRSWEQNGLTYTIFATGTVGTMYNPPANWDTLAECNDITLSSVPATGWSVTTTETPTVSGTTEFSLLFADGTCADIRVVKEGDTQTTIVSDGYNTCDVAAPRRTQREIAVFTSF